MTAHADSTPTITEHTLPTVNSEPLGIITGPDGNLWFAEESSGKIGRMTPSGQLTEFTPPTTPQEANICPDSVANGPDGAIWFTDSCSSSVGRVTTSGVFSKYTLPDPNASPLPRDITEGPDGGMWFVEARTNEIGRISMTGQITEFPLPVTQVWTQDGTDGLHGIVAGPDGALWFTGEESDIIGRISTTGDVSEYSMPSNIQGPNKITVGPDGALWFSAAGLNDNNFKFYSSIGRITTSGDITNYPLSQSGIENGAILAQDLAFGPDGAIWFTDSNTDHIGRMTTDGNFAEYSTPSTSLENAPLMLTAGSDGAMWYTEQSNTGTIGRIALAGSTPPAPVLAQAINTGGTGSGNFVADSDFSGGASYTSEASVDTSQVVSPAPQEVYQSVRYGNNFSYTIPNLTPSAPYTLDLDFNELYWGTSLANGGGVGSRVFNVSVNGAPDLINFDVYQTAGGANKAIREQFPTTADANGNVTVQFTADTDNAMVSGLELFDGNLPALPTPPPPAIVSSAYIAAGGGAVGNFVADTDFLGGTPYSSSAGVDTSGLASPAPEAVYQNSRYGNFTYSVPNLTANTSYNIQLDFNELYWGTSLAGGVGGAGSRVFNVAINGSQVLTNFDIFGAAGGANKAIAENFTATSDANGTINIQFSSLLDNAMVSGIEISQAQ